jgi:hypothetical protein
MNTKQLSDVVHFLTAQEGFKPAQFLFATLTTRSSMGTTEQRVSAMNAALTKLVNQRWWKRDVLGYEMAWDFSGSMDSPDGWLNAHLHGLWITRDGVDCEELKRRVFGYLKGQLGDLIGWDESAMVWRRTLEPARLTPGLGRYIHGHVWRGSHEVGATVMKHDKQRGAYRNHFERSVADLAEIQPLIRAQLLRVRRGGIVSKVRQLLTLRADIHDDVTTAEQHQVPPHYRNGSHEARRAFRQLIEDPRTPAGLRLKLIEVPPDITVERWEAVVIERAGATVSPKVTNSHQPMQKSALGTPQGHPSPTRTPSAASRGIQAQAWGRHHRQPGDRLYAMQEVFGTIDPLFKSQKRKRKPAAAAKEIAGVIRRRRGEAPRVWEGGGDPWKGCGQA